MSEVGGNDSHLPLSHNSNLSTAPAIPKDPRQAAEERAMQQMQLTREELRVLKECNQESFWYRCVPMSIFCMSATQLAVNRGALAPHPKYGALLKNMAAGLVGYIVGKLSYTRTCKEKMMTLDNSQLAESLRRQKYGRHLSRAGDSEFAPDLAEPAMKDDGAHQSQTSDYHSNTDISSDANRHFSGLDDSFRPTIDSMPSSNGRSPNAQKDEPQRPQLSYDDLRRQNRDDYQKRLQQQPAQSPRPNYQYSPSPGGYQGQAPLPRQPLRSQGDGDQPRLGGYRSPPKSGKNQYGDSLDDQ